MSDSCAYGESLRLRSGGAYMRCGREQEWASGWSGSLSWACWAAAAVAPQ